MSETGGPALRRDVPSEGVELPTPPGGLGGQLGASSRGGGRGLLSGLTQSVRVR